MRVCNNDTWRGTMWCYRLCGQRQRKTHTVYQTDLIIDHALTPRTVPAQDLHVILFGDTGIGKSSLVNLLAGWHVADVSPDSVACTLDSTEYQFQLGATTIRLWDTVGLEEPKGGASGYMGAIGRPS
ncbi:hypothetical protein JVT61DRAFT_15618 [Boletus reticuloceps]|uniref:G domain-containing protein n=1 Tax=Boletus reticuloceps TaxID=495285 RepID=A0A8I2YC73_9AGAM|nr:hypothetical protein JVT61DRAFT_15618 [Boletus reticuloceps]